MGTGDSFFLLHVQQTSAFRKGHSLLQLCQHVAQNEMGRECGMYGGEERCIQGFDGEVNVKFTLVRVTKAQRGSRAIELLFL